ncbi:unnamed protein product [Pieris macdunnoughi]|uniref:MD-2-related lipid-recognition domain-containing protein n=1 Tax=Pieris macdunnoughi TaxID=345717 RepID=A0A821VMI7_9NEOP|nr:unnamed protein product [Pieris macdunnoughi]
MFSKSVVVCCLLAFSAATDVLQCPGKNTENLKENVQLSPCKKPPCKLKKGTDQHITINFTPNEDVVELKNRVVADVFGVDLPFVGVDGNSVCDKILTADGQKAPCPLKAGVKYTYKDSFPVLEFYPNIEVKVHWALISPKSEIICFETPVKIVSKK